VFQEASIMKMFCHPNIIQLKERYVTKSEKLCIVMKYADGNDLQSYLEKRRISGCLSEQEVLTKFTQICLAVKFLHDRNVEHKNIKASNVLLTKEGICKLADIQMDTLEKSNLRLNLELVDYKPFSSFPPECFCVETDC